MSTNMVHKPISMLQAVAIPAANDATDRDRCKLRMKHLSVCYMIIMLIEHYRNSILHRSWMMLVQQTHHKSHQTHYYTRRTFLSRVSTLDNFEHQRMSRLYFVYIGIKMRDFTRVKFARDASEGKALNIFAKHIEEGKQSCLVARAGSAVQQQCSR